MVISMLKIRRPLGRLIFNMGIAIPGKTVFLIETAPRYLEYTACIPMPYLSSLPWIFPEAPLKFNGDPGNIQGSLTALQCHSPMAVSSHPGTPQTPAESSDIGDLTA